MIKILGGILVGGVILAISVNLWAIMKSWAFFRSLLADPTELSRIILSRGVDEFLTETGKISEIGGSFAVNIRILTEAHFGALKKTRNVLIASSLILILVLYVMGFKYLIAGICVLILPSLLDIPASAKNYNATLAFEVAVILRKWNQVNQNECRTFCKEKIPRFKEMYKVLEELSR